MTFTSDINFREVIKNIKESAFKKTQSPFFLSIEMHCSDEQQKVMANIFNSVLVDMWIPDAKGSNIPKNFPSPNELKGKFIVKVVSH
jgi:phosphatidylinositol phospholipase C, delta